ncbi:MAG: hypothetical protein EOP58_01080 [Sphingomonadales bacterium]|nr:MAG: hypothetical protein EOP58_01080 [Sphingomonadales bacterium]
MAKKPKTTTAIVPVATAVQHRLLAGTDIMPVEVYHVRDRHPSGDGPWSAEADKVSWIDPDTGLPCIMRRGNDGALCGYVGVGPDHPLAGVGEEALPHDPPIIVHGGIDYASPCEEYEPQEVSVCHIRVPRQVSGRSSASVNPPFDARTMVALTKLPDEVWWFGFSCNQPYDLVPKDRHHVRALGLENGRVYRDERYVVRETSNLAAQLHAIGEGQPMPELKGERPPVGLADYDPVRRR